MDQNQSLILRNADEFQLAPQFRNLIAETLAASPMLQACESADDQKELVLYQQRLKSTINTIEKARVAAKAPLLAASKMLDDTVKKETDTLQREGMHAAQLVSGFQELERIKAAAAKQAADRQAADLERQRAELLKTATSVEEADQIQEDFSQRVTQAQATAAAIAPPKAAGQVVKEDWEIEVSNAQQFCKFHFDLVRSVQPDLLAIKQQLNAGKTIIGITARRKMVSTVRSSPVREIS